VRLSPRQPLDHLDSSSFQAWLMGTSGHVEASVARTRWCSCTQLLVVVRSWVVALLCMIWIMQIIRCMHAWCLCMYMTNMHDMDQEQVHFIKFTFKCSYGSIQVLPSTNHHHTKKGHTKQIVFNIWTFILVMI